MGKKEEKRKEAAAVKSINPVLCFSLKKPHINLLRKWVISILLSI